MAVVDLVLVFTWLLLVAGVRGYLQARRTDQAAIRFADRPGSPQWWSRSISVVGLALVIAAPLAALAGLPPIPALDHLAINVAGIGLYVLGIVITLASQVAMGPSWRGDVDPDVRTDLVTTGPYRFVRNPILLGTAITAVGFSLIVPNLLSVAMLVAIATSLEIQVRLVEEPYLLRVHGDSYRDYAARTGRFLPGIGRLKV